jgi:hypothetical protein
MPWKAFTSLTRSDANAIAGYLKSLAKMRNKVPGPFGPNENDLVCDDGRVARAVTGRALRR